MTTGFTASPPGAIVRTGATVDAANGDAVGGAELGIGDREGLTTATLATGVGVGASVVDADAVGATVCVVIAAGACVAL